MQGQFAGFDGVLVNVSVNPAGRSGTSVTVNVMSFLLVTRGGTTNRMMYPFHRSGNRIAYPFMLSV
ncbi:hypothetical protein RFN57_00690 [Streptomyces violaceochromogenes]|uniref:Uncharacterized protein n=1 Tax=Streptomyces violaceochromogenes TaxID=67377 RepID=A0ABU6LMU3_9ACTN|nr:hypothetical protein [Streptomyces violaceochromogenes]MEC7050839.1 hypothetical protein [Streptomyces violaceochromogenes]